MSTLLRRSNYPILDTRNRLDAAHPLHLGSQSLVAVEEFEADGQYIVRVDIPGVDPDRDLSVSIDGDVLTIRGERREEKRDKHRSEVRYGEFSRSFHLPPGRPGDDVSARYENGVLEVTVRTPEKPVESHRIVIEHGE